MADSSQSSPEVTITVDGACKNNHDPDKESKGGYGFVVREDGDRVYKDRGSPDRVDGEMTNVIAEYRGVINAVEYVSENYPDTKVSIMTDSETVVRQVMEGCEINEEHLVSLYDEVWELLEKVDVDLSYSGETEEADKLAKIARDE